MRNSKRNALLGGNNGGLHDRPPYQRRRVAGDTGRRRDRAALGGVMANMSYCQFENTLADLRQCNDWLAEHEPTRDLSANELKAFKRLVTLCTQIASDYA